MVGETTGDPGAAQRRDRCDAALGRRLLRRPTTAETERIARGCPPEGLSIPVIVDAIRRETGCSRATAYRAVSDAFAADVLRRTADEGA
jgi:hypothetical protein